MNHDVLLAHIEKALLSIKHPRFYESERGFQGELLVMLRKAIPDKLLPPGAVIEQEYQKRLEHHGLKIRPDIIIHEPFDPARHASREDGNIAVVELKRKASRQDAEDDFESLMRMMEALAYPLGVFINVASTDTYADAIPQAARGRIMSFATSLSADGVRVIRGGA